MKTQKKQKQSKLTADQSKLLFNFNKAYENKKIYTKLTADLKDSAVTIVDANGGQVFTTQGRQCPPEGKRSTVDRDSEKPHSQGNFATESQCGRSLHTSARKQMRDRRTIGLLVVVL